MKIIPLLTVIALTSTVASAQKSGPTLREETHRVRLAAAQAFQRDLSEVTADFNFGKYAYVNTILLLGKEQLMAEGENWPTISASEIKSTMQATCQETTPACMASALLTLKAGR